jgi:alpha-tubulin suppressor-like RCC1 family protein
MPLTKVETHNIDNYAVTTEKLSNTAVAAFAQTLTPKISTITQTDNTYTALDDTAMNTSGGFIVITGADFQSGATVIVDTITANSTTFVNTSTLRAELPARPAGTYALYVVNPDGGTAIRVNGLTYSAFPAFSTDATLATRYSNTAFAVSISAASDSNISYSNTSTLPAGTSLLANGYFFGTVSIGVETVYSFTVKATDVELQDTSRTFSLTVSIALSPGLYAWGFNNGGSLGFNDTVPRSSPVQVGSEATWNSISGGHASFAAGIKTNGTLWSWGTAAVGQLGQNDVVVKSSPTQVGTNTNWSLITNSRQFAAAIKTDGTLWTWGQGTDGELGLNIGGTVRRSSPTQVGTNTNWSKIALSMSGGAAIKTTGTLWAWGRNGNGDLGLNLSITSYRSSPVQVGAGTDWSLISSSGTLGNYRFAAIKTTGTLWTWGDNDQGQLGRNNVLRASSPTQVGSGTNWSKIFYGMHAMAIKTDGTLWTWGLNTHGQLGQNDTAHRSSPVQVGTGTDWNLIAGSRYHSVAIKTNGTMWAWGGNDLNNGAGALGQNDVVLRSSPVQVGTSTSWTGLTAGNQFTMGIIT